MQQIQAIPHTNLEDKAKAYAKRKHAGQRRDYTNQPFILHPCRVALKVQRHLYENEQEDINATCIALLHDVVEDCVSDPKQRSAAFQELGHEFNDIISNGVWWLTNTHKLEQPDRVKRKQADLDRLRKAPYLVRLVKCADRIDNLFDYMYPTIKPIKQQRYLYETMLLADAIKDNINDHPLYQELRATMLFFTEHMNEQINASRCTG